jgi:KaiC/GvpD/RAD55 family RecA-like ATPase
MIRDRAKTGIEGLDDMLEGGLLVGRPYVVSGTTGTGKTTLAMHFLREGAANGERVLYVAVDEPPNEVRYNYLKFGWNLEGISVLDGTPDILSYDKTPVRDVSSERQVVALNSVGEAIRRTSEKGPTDVTINTIQELVKQEFKQRKYTRVVIDSLTSLKFFYIRTSEEFATLQSFFRMLSDLGATALLTVDIPDVHRPGLESQLARGEIRLHKWFDGRGLMRGVTIEKYRGSSHDSRMRHLKITTSGMIVPGADQAKGKKRPSKVDSKEGSGQTGGPVAKPEPKAAPKPMPKHDPEPKPKTEVKPEEKSPLPAPPTPPDEELPPPPNDVADIVNKPPESGGAAKTVSDADHGGDSR